MEVINLILSSIFVIAVPLIFIKIVLNNKHREDKTRIIVFTLISVLLYILTYKYSTGIYKSILGLLVTFIALYNFYNITLNKTILSIVLCMIVLMIPEAIVIYTTIYLFGMPKEEFYNHFAGSISANLSILIVFIIITFILKKPLSKILNLKLNQNNKIIIFSILSLISVLVLFYEIIAGFRIGAKIIFYIIAIATFVIALIIVIYQESKNSKLRTEYNKLLEFMETYEVELEQQRILKHEYKNQLITIKSKLIDNEKKNKVIDYIDNLLGDNTKFSQESYTKLQYLPANGLKALFYFKISEAKNKGINTSVNISASIKNSFIKNLSTKEFKDLGILLGVYLDNAIEASETSNKKMLGIEMYKTEEGITIIISNSYNGIIEENKIGKLHFSTKGKGRGYGLMLVRNTLGNNKKLKTEREITSTLYIQTIIIKK